MIALVQNYIRYNGGLRLALQKLVRTIFFLINTRGVRGLYTQWRETQLRMQQMESEKLRSKSIAHFQFSRKLRILATPHTAFIAHMLDAAFSSYGINSEIIVDLRHQPDNNTVYVVICPQMFIHVPRHMIAFQMEQSTSKRWFDRKYIKRLAAAIAIVDYSVLNIEYLRSIGIPTSLLYLYKLHPISNYRQQLNQYGHDVMPAIETEYDAAFYGDMKCDRRISMLAELTKRFRILIISDLFGHQLHCALLKAKVILNIHYYEPALLESTRITECISLGIPVISERGLPCDDHDLWNGWIRYVPIGDVEAMAMEIERVIYNPPCPATSYQANAHELRAIGFNTARLLIGCGLLETVESRNIQPPSTYESETAICLSLPETPLRRSHAMSAGSHKRQYFDGFRHVQAWKGCALSYSYLASIAQMQKFSWLEVYEDDCFFHSDSFVEIDIVKRYLRQQTEGWDIFSALITTIPDGTSISKVEVFEGVKFVHLNKTMGLVYSIFNSTTYSHLAAWDPFSGGAETNTIDKYLSKKEGLHVITCVPYIVGHQEAIESSIWGFGNHAYSNLISASAKELELLVAKYEIVHNSPDKPAALRVHRLSQN